MDEKERIDRVLAYHLRAGTGGPDKSMHATIHVMVENQIADHTLPVRRTALRLMAEGLDRHEAIHAIGTALIGNLADLARGAESAAGKTDSRPDPNDPYFRELETLTSKGWRRGE
jgi:hypothetical protein